MSVAMKMKILQEMAAAIGEKVEIIDDENGRRVNLPLKRTLINWEEVERINKWKEAYGLDMTQSYLQLTSIMDLEPMESMWAMIEKGMLRAPSPNTSFYDISKRNPDAKYLPKPQRVIEYFPESLTWSQEQLKRNPSIGMSMYKLPIEPQPEYPSLLGEWEFMGEHWWRHDEKVMSMVGEKSIDLKVEETELEEEKSEEPLELSEFTGQALEMIEIVGEHGYIIPAIQSGYYGEQKVDIEEEESEEISVKESVEVPRKIGGREPSPGMDYMDWLWDKRRLKDVQADVRHRLFNSIDAVRDHHFEHRSLDLELIVDCKLRELIKGFLVGVAIEKPHNILEFGLNYFVELAKKTKTEEAETRTRLLNRKFAVCGDSYNPELKLENSSNLICNLSDSTISQYDIVRMIDVTHFIVMFYDMLPDTMVKVFLSMDEEQFNADDVIYDEGDDGDRFFIVKSGIFYAIASVDDEEVVHEVYPDKGYFGELALLYNHVRDEKIVAMTDGVVWSISREKYLQTVSDANYELNCLIASSLEKIPLLWDKLNENEKLSVIECVVVKQYHAGQMFIEVMEYPCLLIVLDGDIKLTVKEPTQICVEEYKSGDIFSLCTPLVDGYFMAKSSTRSKIGILEKAKIVRLTGLDVEAEDPEMPDMYDPLWWKKEWEYTMQGELLSASELELLGEGFIFMGEQEGEEREEEGENESPPFKNRELSV